MRFNHLAMGPALVGCAFVALTSCSTDDKEPSPGLAPTISASTAAASAYDIVKVPIAMTIDGNLNEWTNISAISLADNSGRGSGLDNTAKVKLAWDNTYLYAAYDVTDTELLALQTTRDHGQIFEDDEIELYIDPQGDGASATSMTPTDYQFLANIREALGDIRGTTTGGKDDSYNAPGFLAKVVTNGTLNSGGADVGYTMELRISWADLGVTPAAGNFMRIDPAVGDRDGSGPPPVYAFDWAGLDPFNNPSGWKDVQLVNRPPPTSAYDIVQVPTAMAIDGSLAEWTGISAISMADTAAGWTGKNTAKVKLAWDPTYLYLAYDVTDTDLEAVETARDAGNIYKDDEVEFYIDPQGDGWTAPRMTPTDYQFVANIRDAIGDMKGTPTGGKDASFNAPSFVAKAVTSGTIGGGADVGYTVEARISWTDLGVTPAAGNFLRIDPAVGDWDGSVRPTTPEAFDWASVTPFNNPIGWKDVKLAVDNTAPAAPTNLVLTVVSPSQIDVSWTVSASGDVAKYNIYRATSGTPTLYKTVPANPYHDTGLTPGTYTYQVSAVDAGGNESSKTSAKSATTGGTSGLSLRAGIYDGFSLIGKGPGGDTVPPRYSVLHGIPATTADLPGIIAQAESADVHLLLTLVHSPSTFTDPAPDQNGHKCMTFNWTKYLAWLDDAATHPEVGDALARGRASVFVIDEPLHPNYCGSIKRDDVNRMGLETKARFPGARTIVRAGSNVFSAGTEPAGGGWTGIDYGVASYGRYPVGSTLRDELPGAYYSRQKATLAAVNVGTIPSMNLWDGGGNVCWDYRNTGSSSGRIHGSLLTGTNPGTYYGDGEDCGVQAVGTYWMMSPAVMRETIDAAFNDPDFPVFTFWGHVLNNNMPDTSEARYQAYEARSDIVSGLDYVITKAASSGATHHWRPTK
jgi:cellulose/xylan binding protein with CBM9 domain/fibronectin type III domain protein